MKRLGILMALCAFALGCGDSASSSQPVELSFAAVVGEAPFVCGDVYNNLGASDSSIELIDFRFYVQEVEVKNAAGVWVPIQLEDEGNPFQYGGVALLDFENGCGDMGNPELNASVLGTVPVGDYEGLRFQMGVPFEMNHQNMATAPSPLNISTLFWNWQGGYKFLRIDSGQFSKTDWRMHLGSTGCDGTPTAGGVTSCTNGNRVMVELSTFDASTDTVVADYADLVEGADLDNDQAGDEGCMSKPDDTDCGPLFENLGLPFGGSDAGTQQFFSAE